MSSLKDDDPQTIVDLLNLTKHMNDNVKVLEENIDNLPTEKSTEGESEETTSDSPSEETSSVAQTEPPTTPNTEPKFKIIEPEQKEQNVSIEEAIEKARRGPENKTIIKKIKEKYASKPRKKINFQELKNSKKFKAISTLVGIFILFLVYVFVVHDMIFSKVTLKLNDQLKMQDIEKLVKDKTTLYLNNKNGINIMRFTKEKDYYFLEIKRKSFVLESDSEVIDDENPNAKYIQGEVDYKMIKYVIAAEDGNIRMMDDGNDIIINFKDNKFNLISGIQEYSEYVGKYEPIKTNVKKIQYPFTLEDKNEGFYSAKGKEGYIYVRLSDKKTNSYSITGTINNKKDYYIFLEIASIKNNKASLKNDITIKFKDKRLIIEAPKSNKKADVIQGKYKKETEVLAKDLIEELDEAVNLEGEGSVG